MNEDTPTFRDVILALKAVAPPGAIIHNPLISMVAELIVTKPAIILPEYATRVVMTMGCMDPDSTDEEICRFFGLKPGQLPAATRAQALQALSSMPFAHEWKAIVEECMAVLQVPKT